MPNIDLSSLSSIGKIIAIIAGVGAFFIFLFGDNKRKMQIILLSAVVVIIGGGIWYFVQSQTAQANEWTTVLQDFAPSCDNSGNATWVIPQSIQDSTQKSCPGQGLLMQATSVRGAELDLDRVNGQPYSQTKLDANVQLTFQTASDPNTLAGLLVQTPQQGNGGYFLGINNTGYWELIDNSGKIKASSGQANSGSSFTLDMKVQNGKLYGSINGQQVFAYDDNLAPSPGAVGLVTYSGDGQTIPNKVLFSEFKLQL